MNVSQRAHFKEEPRPRALKLYWPGAVGTIAILTVFVAARAGVFGSWDLIDDLQLAVATGMAQSFCAALVISRHPAARRPVPLLVNFFPVLAIVVWVLVLAQVRIG